MTVDIDSNSGFCAGVIRAIGKAEEFLDNRKDKETRLFSLGSIVHNDAELKRLEAKGLVCIDRDDLDDMMDAGNETLLIRAHGEPPQTYVKAKAHGFNVIDCTCPVVLRLQKDIREAYERLKERNGQIVIFGKPGHAEVLGLIGQVDGKAVVIEDMKMMLDAVADGSIDLRRPVEIFSQTTKSPAEYAAVCARLEQMMAEAAELSMERFKGTRLFVSHNTICSQVASRHAKLSAFAIEHDIIIFVSGKASSNGKVLCERCKSLNIRTYHIDSPEELRKEWFRSDDKAGVCGAASTPKWLLEDVAREILSYND
ncbi:MAG: 4-hydroxy-3-methylbut-2-enyl diphosphate reductase [Bacteroidetes bacterium]|uniref:4-hydroxy-3-methylbut-2-enyl diphosphate reductase n=1 Tax=Candidatus Cryptobacteroides intestinigallinarum TaxID=2840767 RepID=A0A9D9HMG0_9BACT|nr:4-hydroxy-3-methylbut-2-enyl diphosphate reductase [Candidatus Cryptobacteroides intestinigallinarum]